MCFELLNYLLNIIDLPQTAYLGDGGWLPSLPWKIIISTTGFELEFRNKTGINDHNLNYKDTDHPRAFVGAWKVAEKQDWNRHKALFLPFCQNQDRVIT